MTFCILLCIFCIALCRGTQISTIKWETVVYTEKANKQHVGSSASSIPASQYLKDNKKVFMSLTTMKSRINDVIKVVRNIFSGEVVPDRIYLFVSQEPYMLDEGIKPKDIPLELLRATLRFPLEIVYTENIGPHRKLMPLLAKHWDDDVLLVTIDDEFKKNGLMRTYLGQLLKYYVATGGNAVIGLTGRRIEVCKRNHTMMTVGDPTAKLASSSKIEAHSSFKFLDYLRWRSIGKGGPDVLILPTGTGRPRFFHPFVFNHELRLKTKTADDLMFRLTTLINHVPAVIGCRVTSLTGSCPEFVKDMNNVLMYDKVAHTTFKKGFGGVGGEHSGIGYAGKAESKVPTVTVGIVEIASRTSDDGGGSTEDHKESTDVHRKLARVRRPKQRTEAEHNALTFADKGKLGLFHVFNAAGGNNVAWKNATDFLAHQYDVNGNPLLHFEVLMAARGRENQVWICKK